MNTRQLENPTKSCKDRYCALINVLHISHLGCEQEILPDPLGP